MNQARTNRPASQAQFLSFTWYHQVPEQGWGITPSTCLSEPYRSGCFDRLTEWCEAALEAYDQGEEWIVEWTDKTIENNFFIEHTARYHEAETETE